MRKVLLLSTLFFLSFLFNCASIGNKVREEKEVRTEERKEIEEEIIREKEEKSQENLKREEERKVEKPVKPNEVFLTKEQALLLQNITTPEEAKPSIWPVVGIVTSPFGWRGRRFHSGIDIAADYGTPVVATAPGKVIYTGYRRGYGYMVVIYHGYGYSTVYAHMSAIDVKEGELVDRGRIIGFVGSTGRATGPHLHYEVLKYGVRQNPMIYLP